MSKPESIYEAIGGEEAVTKIVEVLYENVAKDAYLFKIFPDDLTEVIRKQKLFLTHFLGGPSHYLQERGHPMLRRRHMEFVVTPKRRDSWLACMNIALDEAEIIEPYRSDIFERLTTVGHHMVNTMEEEEI